MSDPNNLWTADIPAGAAPGARYEDRIAALRAEIANETDPIRREQLVAYRKQIRDEHKEQMKRQQMAMLVLCVVLAIILVVGIILLVHKAPSSPNPPQPGFPASAYQVPSQPTTVSVPDIVGLPEAQARTDIANAGLSVTDSDVKSTTGTADNPGTVLQQDPVAGTEVAYGATVTIWVSQGPGTCVIPPDVVGADEFGARTSLTNAGFTSSPTTTTAPLGQDEPITMTLGQVLTVAPSMGSSVACDTAITLTLATGESVVPNLLGMTADQAMAAAGQKGFFISVQQEAYDANSCNSQPNTVCSQAPDAGSYGYRSEGIIVQVVSG